MEVWKEEKKKNKYLPEIFFCFLAGVFLSIFPFLFLPSIILGGSILSILGP